MFTGIIEERGEIARRDGHRLTVACNLVSRDSAIGDSIAVSGVCLTVVDRQPASLTFDLSAETLERTGLGSLQDGDPVNLERPVSLMARLGGHIVQGHVDGVGSIVGREADGAGGERLRIQVPGDLMRYVVEKGSITVDGVSLTVADLIEGGITIAVIPHTLAVTTLGQAEPQDPVNLEVDVLARYVERAMHGSGAEMKERMG